jgi:hypothetical protein
MADNFTPYQTFCRRFLQDNEFNWEEDADLVRRKVNAFVNGQIDAKLEGSGTVVSSSMGDSSFSFRVEGTYDPDALARYATRFLALIEAYNPKDQDPAWPTRTPEEKAAFNARAIAILRRKTLARPAKTRTDYSRITL